MMCLELKLQFQGFRHPGVHSWRYGPQTLRIHYARDKISLMRGGGGGASVKGTDVVEGEKCARRNLLEDSGMNPPSERLLQVPKW
jgi:hypothetical protein